MNPWVFLWFVYRKYYSRQNRWMPTECLSVLWWVCIYLVNWHLVLACDKVPNDDYFIFYFYLSSDPSGHVTQPPLDHWERQQNAAEMSCSFKTWFREGKFNLYKMHPEPSNIHAWIHWICYNQYMSTRLTWSAIEDVHSCRKIYQKCVVSFTSPPG